MEGKRGRGMRKRKGGERMEGRECGREDKLEGKEKKEKKENQCEEVK